MLQSVTKTSKRAKKSQSINLNNVFYCKYCDYTTCKKNNLERHKKTKKHQKNVTKCNAHLLQSVTKNEPKHFQCDICYKDFNNRMSMWRHKKKCCKKIEIKENLSLEEENKLLKLKLLEKENEILKTKIDALSSGGGLGHNGNQNNCHNNIGTQNNTQNISINVYLNEHCKNAMSLEDFVDKINVSLKDIQETKQLGYVDGLSNIFLKSLKDMPDTERPIHSTDKKRSKFVIKGGDGWEKDDGTKVDNAVSKVKFKHVNALTEWEENNPNYEHDPTKLSEWQQLLENMNPGTSQTEKVKNNTAVKKKIAEAVCIKEAINNLTE